MSISSGVNQNFRYNLTNARSGELERVAGGYIIFSEASDSSATIQVAVTENYPDRFQTLKLGDAIKVNGGFEKIFIKNDAQSGKWGQLTITNSPEDYDVLINAQGVIDSVGQIDTAVPIDDSTPIKVDDDATQTLLTTISGDIADVAALLVNDEDLRAPLTTLEGASYATVTNSTSTVVTGGTNTSGIIIRECGVSSFGSTTAYVRAGGNSLLETQAGSGAEFFGTLKDIFIPAGQALAISASSTLGKAWVFYEVL